MRQPSPLELYCRVGETGLSELPESMVVVDRGPNSLSVQAGVATGPWIQPLIETNEPIFPSDWRETWDPVPVVLIGHFDDPRALQCPPELFVMCRERFVVTDVAWPPG